MFKPKNLVSIALSDGSKIVLKDSRSWFMPADERNVNVVKLDSAGKLMWRIEAIGPAGEDNPYTGISLDDEGRLLAYNWIGADCVIDIATGTIVSSRLVR